MVTNTTIPKISIKPLEKKVSIQSIVESDDQDSELCRDILSWHIRKFKDEDTRIEFGFTELGNWLLEHHMPFVNEYSGSKSKKSYRLHSKRTYIQSRLKNLIYWDLMMENGTTKSEKNYVDIPLYSFTTKGIFLAWLLEAKNTKDRDRSNAIDMAFEVLLICLEIINSYSSRFFSDFLKKCVAKGISTNFHGNENYLKSFIIFAVQLAFPIERPLDLFSLFFSATSPVYEQAQKLFLETVNELDKETQRMILLKFKLQIENEYDDFYITEEWTKMRYNNIQNHNKVTVPVKCGACNAEYPFEMSVVDFLKFPYNFNGLFPTVSLFSKTVPKLDCMKCRKLNTVTIGSKRKKTAFSPHMVLEKMKTLNNRKY